MRHVLNRVPAFLEEVERVRGLFRTVKLRRGGIYELMAILILRLQACRSPIEVATLERFKAIYQELKQYHWWLTGPNDFPACAILVGESDSPPAIASGIEEIYRALNDRGFSRGDPLQTAANLLYLVIKDHPFSDGNKRIGSFLFVLYLRQEAIGHRLNPEALTALALLVAESAPASKDLMIRLIMNLLVERAA